jgi:hydroxymethylpyrimidine pyrophosphatase-like HAD family hydrolase
VKSTGGATHMRHLLPRETAASVLRHTAAFRRGAAIVFDRPRANQVIYEDIDWEDPQRKDYYMRNREFIARVSPLADALTEDPIQVMYTGPVAEMRRAEASLRATQAHVPFSLAVTYYDSRDFALVDVIGLHCSKGATLAKWTAHLGLGCDEVMAIGDNLNDREMLEFAGLPIIMANSVPELKEFGWQETLSNDDDGVAAAIDAYALGNTKWRNTQCVQ